MGKQYDPFALDKPTLKLGEHGEYTLGDATEQRINKIRAIGEALEALSKPTKKGEAAPEPTVADIARGVGDLCEAACENAAGLSDLIVDLTDEAKHGEKAIGLLALKGVAEFVKTWLAGEESAGEG